MTHGFLDTSAFPEIEGSCLRPVSSKKDSLGKVLNTNVLCWGGGGIGRALFSSFLTALKLVKMIVSARGRTRGATRGPTRGSRFAFACSVYRPQKV